MAKKKPNAKSLRRRPWIYLGVLGGLILLFLGVAQLPGVHERVYYHYTQARAKIYYFFRKPQEQVFVPMQEAQAKASPSAVPGTATQAAVTPTTALASPSPSVQASPSPSAVALPAKAQIEGIEPEKQGLNNCGPTTLGMYLNFWGVQADQHQIAAVIHQKEDDRNVGLDEMRDYVLANTQLKAILRHGGSFEMLKKMVSQGFPVMLERGFYTANTHEWMGHYGLVTGYDDALQTVHVPDTYHGHTDFKMQELERLWMHFSYTYLLVYPEDKEAEVRALLGEDWDEDKNGAHSEAIMRQRALTEAPETYPEDAFFARFGIGNLLVLQKAYAEAAAAFDEAFKTYAKLPIYKRPFRVMWYQFGPYEAYYQTERFQDCVNLAQNTIANSSASGLEESWYWRGKCTEGLGDKNSAIWYYKKALEWHPGWQPALEALEMLGE
ncbi:MAG: C39 family peptidase [Anaerolineaceae bacterium]|nr:C39 family peptidase [Anaerolineaceae bacterium]